MMRTHTKKFDGNKNKRDRELKIHLIMAQHGIAPEIVSINNKKNSYTFTTKEYDDTFQAFLKKKSTTIEELKIVIKKVVILIEKMHMLGYRHGDLHHKNIMVSQIDSKKTKKTMFDVKIIDFGANPEMTTNGRYDEFKNELLYNKLNTLQVFDHVKNYIAGIQKPLNSKTKMVNVYRELIPQLGHAMYSDNGTKLDYYEFLYPIYTEYINANNNLNLKNKYLTAFNYAIRLIKLLKENVNKPKTPSIRLEKPSPKRDFARSVSRSMSKSPEKKKASRSLSKSPEKKKASRSLSKSPKKIKV